AGLESYITRAVQEREKVKFIFTKNLSLAMDMIISCAEGFGISRERSSYITWNEILSLVAGALTRAELEELIHLAEHRYVLTGLLELPSVILCEDDLYAFEYLDETPNFITANVAVAPVAVVELEQYGDVHQLEGCIVMISQADPGY